MKSIGYLGFKYPHHGRYSSYALLMDYYPDTYERIAGWISREPSFSKLLGARQYAASLLLSVVSAPESAKYKLIHYLYPECSLTKLTGRKNIEKSVLTIHYPIAHLLKCKNDFRKSYFEKSIKDCRGVIALTSQSANQIKDHYKIKNSKFIPHGVDVSFFSKNRQHVNVKKFKLITVGNMLRDWDTWICVSRAIICKRRDIIFSIVGRPPRQVYEFAESSDARKCIKILTGISDDELVSEYQSSSALFLPLLDATANNAIVEAMACGLPVISSNLPAVHDYVPSYNQFFSNADEAVDILLSCDPFENTFIDVGFNNRLHAENALSWESVAKQSVSYISSLC